MTIGLTTNYFSFGSGAPSTAPSVASGEYALYQNTANGDLYEWNLSGTPAWTKVFDHAGGSTNLYNAYLCYQDQKTSGTNGGTFTSGAWRTRDLNTEVADTASHGSVASNQVTLDAGTYTVRASAPGHFCNNHQSRLQNITASTTLATGTTEFASASAGNPQSPSFLTGHFTLGVSSVIELQHQCATTRATDGFGAAASFGTEVYSMLEFWKE